MYCDDFSGSPKAEKNPKWTKKGVAFDMKWITNDFTVRETNHSLTGQQQQAEAKCRKKTLYFYLLDVIFTLFGIDGNSIGQKAFCAPIP